MVTFLRGRQDHFYLRLWFASRKYELQASQYRDPQSFHYESVTASASTSNSYQGPSLHRAFQEQCLSSNYEQGRGLNSGKRPKTFLIGCIRASSAISNFSNCGTTLQIRDKPPFLLSPRLSLNSPVGYEPTPTPPTMFMMVSRVDNKQWNSMF